MILEEDDHKRDILYSCFIQELQQNTIPVKKKRTFPRNNKAKANRYAKAKRRCL
jgi:hypothetical protein